MKKKILLKKIEPNYREVIQEGLEWIGMGSRLKRGDAVFLKPNLTFPLFQKGVMTNPSCIEALVIALKDYTDKIVIGEADSGGYNRFSIDEVFHKTGVHKLEEKYGIRVVNLSSLPHRSVEIACGSKRLGVPLPVLLLDEIDQFITVPVPKIHMYTQISVAVKNQWGCIPQPHMRLRLHPFFEPVILGVNQHLPPSIAVVDGKYGLNRSGPLRGDPVDLNWLMISNDIYAADLLACRLMGIDSRKIRYLRFLQKKGILPKIGEVQIRGEVENHIKEKFYLQKDWTDSLSTLAFRFSSLNYLAYYSRLSDFLHKVLYLFRKPFYDYESPDKTQVKGE